MTRNRILLSASESACLQALREGAERKVRIALRAHLNLRQTDRSLRRLAALQLAVSNDRREWYLTPRARRAEVAIAPVTGKRGRKPGTARTPGVAAARLLALLDRPRRGTELTALLGVTRQRVHQLVVALAAFDLIRMADARFPTFVIARRDDHSILLRPDQERLLSAFPNAGVTTTSCLARVFEARIARLTAIAQSLCDAGLIEKTGATVPDGSYRLTLAGAGHWQRSATAPRAERPSLRLPFRSDRVQAVLSLLESNGRIRTRDIGATLGIGSSSINALMQYLKRKQAVRPESELHFAPYVLTDQGREILGSMRRRAEARIATDGETERKAA